MYQTNRFTREKQRRYAAARLSSALMEAVDEAQYAVLPRKTFDFLACVRFVLSKAGIIALCGLLCTVLTLAFYQIVPLKYQATAKLYILENNGTGVQMSALQASSLLLSDYREVLKTWEVHDAVRSQLGLDMTYREMQKMLTVQIPSGSRLLYITVKHEDPVLAANLANAYAQAAYTFIVESLHGMQPDLFSSAIIPSRTSGLGLVVRLLIAFATGMLLAAGGYVIFFCLDDRIRTMEDLALASDAQVLAAIPRRKGKLISPNEKEKACMLATQFLSRGVSCILVSAPHSGAGVSFVCDDLLQAITFLHRRALWIRVEHKPFWNHASGKTLGDFLKGECKWEALVQPYEGGSLLAITGTEDELPSQLFHPRMAVLMEKLRSAYDVILVDAPPANQRADASAFFPYCNATLLVAAYGQTCLDDAAAYIEQLGVDAPVAGAVLNRIPVKEQALAYRFSGQKAGVEA